MRFNTENGGAPLKKCAIAGIIRFSGCAKMQLFRNYQPAPGAG